MRSSGPLAQVYAYIDEHPQLPQGDIVQHFACNSIQTLLDSYFTLSMVDMD